MRWARSWLGPTLHQSHRDTPTAHLRGTSEALGDGMGQDKGHYGGDQGHLRHILDLFEGCEFPQARKRGRGQAGRDRADDIHSVSPVQVNCRTRTVGASGKGEVNVKG